MKSLLKIYNIETDEIRLVSSYDKLIEAPNWTPDGKHLVYNAEGNLYYHDLSTGSERLLDTGDKSCINDHVISSDGKFVATSAGIPYDGEVNGVQDFRCFIYIMPAEGGELKLITPLFPSFLHGWSPDMKEIAYCAYREGDLDIYTMELATGIEKRLTDAPGLDDGPEYSYDGKHIWFNSVRSGLMQAYRMNADGTEQTQMTFDNMNNWFPHISPDNKKVVFISYDPRDVEPGDHPPNKNVKIRMMNADGSNVRTLVELFGGQGTINVNSWNPESTEFAFVTYEL